MVFATPITVMGLMRLFPLRNGVGIPDWPMRKNSGYRNGVCRYIGAEFVCDHFFSYFRIFLWNISGGLGLSYFLTIKVYTLLQKSMFLRGWESIEKSE